MSQPYAEAIDLRPAVSYILHGASLNEQTVNMITLTHFEEGNLLSEYCNDTEIGYESDYNSTLAP